MTRTWQDVIEGTAPWSCEEADALNFLRALPDDSASLVFCSPPYTDARTYGVDADRDSAEWVLWLRPIVVEACRVSKCLAFFNVSDSVNDCRYGCGPEWLFADLTRADGLAAVRPYIWHKIHPTDEDAPNNGQPGSGGKHFHRNCWEPVYGFADPAKLPPPWSDNKAFGTPPRHKSGGAMSNRVKDGSRTPTGRIVKYGNAGQPSITNPGNVVCGQCDDVYSSTSFLTEVITYGYACETSPQQTLRSLQQAIDSRSVFEWGVGVCTRLHAASVLRPDVYGSWQENAFRTAVRFLRSRVPAGELRNEILFAEVWVGESDEGRPGDSGSECQSHRSEGDDREGEVRKVRSDRTTRGSSQRRKPIEQRSGQPRSSVRDLPRNSPQPSGADSSTVQSVWEESGEELQAIWDAVRRSLPEMQEARIAARREGSWPWREDGISRTSDVIRAIVGGGHLGHPLAHEGEAPMPLTVAERFVCWFCPPGGIVCDPFAGSGTTAHASRQHGRRFIGCDLRASQVDITARRMRTVTPPLPGVTA